MLKVFAKRVYRYLIGFTVAFLLHAHSTSAQIYANAISYQVTLELGYYDPVYYWQTDADTTTVLMEVDMYYDNDNRKTVSRIVKQPEDFQLPVLELFYCALSTEEFLIDEANQFIRNIKGISSSLTPTRAKKTILGYKCKGYTFTDFQGINIFIYVASKLPSNLCPWGNFDLKGTVLEMYTSNGYHYVATNTGTGELAAGFFDLPQWPAKTIAIPAAD